MEPSSVPSCDEVIALNHVEELGNVFALGCHARRVTFADQQARAFNLVWSLLERGRIRKGDRVAVVGAGLAGLTASAVVSQLGCKTTLLERHSGIMALQRGNLTRFIHPNIYDWPARVATVPTTRWPLLNWRAGYADEVVEQIESQWPDLAKRIDQLYGYEVCEIHSHHDVVWISARSRLDRFDRGFECVLLATGFGLEPDHFGLGSHRPYWNTDDLHQPIVHTISPLEVLVSGNGDGGLVDTLRLAIRDFRHAQIASTILSDRGLDGARQELIEIESRVSPMSDERAAQELWRAYNRLPVPRVTLEQLKRRCRHDTAVTLNGLGPFPLQKDSAIINRILVSLLLRIRAVKYLPGRVTAIERIEQDCLAVQIATSAGVSERRFARVVQRHGPRPVNSELIPSDAALRLRHNRETQRVDDRIPAWPSEYYQTMRQGSARSGIRVHAAKEVEVPIGVVLNGSAPYAFDIMQSFAERSLEMLSANAMRPIFRHVIGVPRSTPSAMAENSEIITNLLKTFSTPGPRTLVTIGSAVSEAMSVLPLEVPHIFVGVTDAVESNLISRTETQSRKHARTGVQFPSVVADKARFMLEIMHANGFSTLGFIHHPDYSVDLKFFQKLTYAFRRLDASIRPTLVPAVLDASHIAVSDECDVYCGWIFLHLHLRQFLAALSAPIFGGAAEDVRNGAFCALGPDDQEMGQVAVESILFPHLVFDHPLSAIPVLAGRRRRVTLNARVARSAGVVIPDHIAKSAVLIE